MRLVTSGEQVHHPNHFIFALHLLLSVQGGYRSHVFLKCLHLTAVETWQGSGGSAWKEMEKNWEFWSLSLRQDGREQENRGVSEARALGEQLAFLVEPL